MTEAHTKPVVHDEEADTYLAQGEADNLPKLGPDSILWQRFGDWRSLFSAVYAGVLQVTQKDVSRALIQHSNFFDNEVGRLVRSAFPIVRTVYEGDEPGAMIRDFHRNIKGTHEDGTRYHSMNPEAFYWAHATFLLMPYVLAGKFSPALSDAEKEQLFQESRTWYSYYGVAEPKNAPTNYPEFEAYVEDFLQNNLHQTETFERSRIVRVLDMDPPLPWIPKWLWKPVSPYAARLLVWVTTGLLPQNLRDEFGWSWTQSDERRFKAFYRTVRAIFSVLPRKVRMVPIAERAFKRAEAQA